MDGYSYDQERPHQCCLGVGDLTWHGGHSVSSSAKWTPLALLPFPSLYSWLTQDISKEQTLQT